MDFLFLKVLKVRRPGRKMSGFRTVWILKFGLTSGPDAMMEKIVKYCEIL